MHGRGGPLNQPSSDFTEPANLYIGKTMIAYPKIFPWRNLYKKAGGLYIDSVATVSMQAMAAGAETRFTTDGSQPGTASTLYTRPFTIDTTTVVTARSFDKAGNASQPVTAFYRIASSGQGHGVKAIFYPGNDWGHLPVLSTMTDIHEWNSFEFSLDRDQLLPFIGKEASSFGILMEGFLKIDLAGKYSFYTQTDDGSKLYIDGKEVVNHDGDHGVIERTGAVELSAGQHKIGVAYYNGGGSFWPDALYCFPGVPKQIIPANNLFLQEQQYHKPLKFNTHPANRMGIESNY
jgi:hypothetical protein